MIVVIVERQIVLVENRAGLAGAEGVKRAAQHGYAGDFGQLVQRCKILFLPCQGIGFTGLRIILPDWIEPQAGINGLMHIDIKIGIVLHKDDLLAQADNLFHEVRHLIVKMLFRHVGKNIVFVMAGIMITCHISVAADNEEYGFDVLFGCQDVKD